MRRKKREPANDNLPVANDNQKRADYMCSHMRWRRRHPGKTLRQLLRDSLDIIAANAPADDPNAQAFIATVRDLLEPDRLLKPADHAQDAS